jgi:hypothetical protein
VPRTNPDLALGVIVELPIVIAPFP